MLGWHCLMVTQTAATKIARQPTDEWPVFLIQSKAPKILFGLPTQSRHHQSPFGRYDGFRKILPIESPFWACKV